ncbi:hypothetical protein GCM10010520_57580 [Rhizobium viscosum]|uniref:NUDIX family NTP pyrophosphohydrolase n=1 Tax=Rhizobium viscosum TaxID=1673 RepID=A0ABR9IVP9_RHIVS|nr:putative NUDIX family NTP pyrophosphohydrolase [Rhizobium viscosum]
MLPTCPSGLVEPGEDELAAAKRETFEELGGGIDGDFNPLGEYRQPGGKVVVAWYVEADLTLDLNDIRSSEFQMEWPLRSGRIRRFPEVDRADWFSLKDAAGRMLKGSGPCSTTSLLILRKPTSDSGVSA